MKFHFVTTLLIVALVCILITATVAQLAVHLVFFIISYEFIKWTLGLLLLVIFVKFAVRAIQESE